MDHLQNGAVDEDAFLTQLESKLRPPFSSLELAKAVSQAALTERADSSNYLEQVAAVLPRAEKNTQLRLLVGLLGLDTVSSENDAAIRTILESAQEAPIYDEWVRVIAGIVQSTLFGEQQEGNGDASKSEAQETLDKTCRDIIGRVRKVERDSGTIDEDTEHRLGQSDADPTLAHYRYSLIAPELLHKILPETESHDHFQVDEGAGILLMDAKLELEKKTEEEEYQQTGVTAAAAADKKQSEQPASSAPDFPGFRSVTSKAKAKQPQKKSSLFIPAKRPVPSAGAGGAKRTLGGTKPALKPVQRTGLHQRKAGAAQALLGKNRRARGAIAGAGAAGTKPAAASKMAQARSKMKMIAVEEVQGLEQSKKEEQTNAKATTKLGRKAQLLAGKKRSKPDSSGAAAAHQPESKVARQKTNHDVDEGEDSKPAAKAEPTTALATAALTAYQVQQGSAREPPMAMQQQRPSVVQQQQHHHHARQKDWRDYLQEKNNRLSPEDHARITQFFTNHHNPTPDQLTYKMKLHEERTQDPKTGEPIKETYYLELDYQTFKANPSKKVKRY